MLTAGSHVHELVGCLEIVQQWQAKHPAHAELATELEVHLCELMQSMITSPMTGKMFAPPPHAFRTQAELDASLAAQTAV
jgi:drug/metabolite transporter superfamily protein YnfA